MKSHREIDLLLLHAPSVYDFRERAILYGPVSDMIPSSTVFEMYPLGFLTIASYLHDRGHAGADRESGAADDEQPPLRRAGVPRAPAAARHRHRPALAAARARRAGSGTLAKEAHPDVPVIMGGLSVQLLSPGIDRLPARWISCCAATARSRRCISCSPRCEPARRSIAMPNLTWKDAGGVHVNPHTFLPMTLDYVDLRPDLMVEMVTAPPGPRRRPAVQRLVERIRSRRCSR